MIRPSDLPENNDNTNKGFRIPGGRFPLGRVVITAGAKTHISDTEAIKALIQHATGDWGEVSIEDWAINDNALEEGARLLSAYKTTKGTRFWIITEADRSVTTILLPEEY